ncbi:hypothetical protein G9A89_018331 [Geosiphon pyriformis]|nr:hypothetical protein G9A89_018331 [Geosiphon pyriformis]
MESKASSISSLSDLENMKNTITKETSYANSDTSMVNDIEDNTTPRKMHTHTYVLGQPPKTPLFDILSNDNNMVALLSPKFAGSKKLHSVGSHVSEKCIFNPVKSFILDIEISALPGKTIGNKLITVKKIFYWVDSFGGASAPLKLSDIIRSSFISELSLIKAKKMAISEKILVNIDVRKPNSHSNWEVIVKKILVDLSKLAIESVFSKFVEFKSLDVASSVASKWSVLMNKDFVRVALAINNKELWVVRDYHWTLLYTLSVGTTVHNLSDLVTSYGRKTCFIGHNSVLYARDRCVVICFNNETSRLAAIGFVLVYKGVNLHWTGLSLACCAKCKQFGHISDMCSVGKNSGVHHRKMVSSQDQIRLANIYKKKQVPVACPMFFGGKSWAQVADGSPFCVSLSVLSGAGLLLSTKLLVMAFNPFDDSGLAKCLVSLECSLELLSDQVSDILKKLNLVNLVPMSSLFCTSPSLVAPSLDSALDLNMAVNSIVMPSSSSLLLVDKAAPELSLSSSKVLTTKVGGLESKMLALEISVSLVLERLDSLCSGLVWKIATCNVWDMNNPAKQENIIYWHKDMGNLISIITKTKLQSKTCPWIADRFNGVWVFTSGVDSDNLGSGVAIIMDIFLACYMCKISEISGQLLFVRLLFKNKLSVSILGLYAGVFLSVWFSQAGEINFMIAKAVNKSSFVVLGGDFNEDGSHKCASFRKCFDFGLVNSFGESSLVKTLTWANSHGVTKTINFLFISSNLVNAVMNHNVYGTVFMSVGLGELLDVQLNSICKQTNMDQWKFDFKGADVNKWKKFKDAMLANARMLFDEFDAAIKHSDLDAMWNVLCKIMILLANKIFKKKWFKNIDSVFTKVFLKFHKLELLVSKIVKAFCEENVASFDLIDSGAASNHKSYHVFKLAEFLAIKEANIRAAIDKRIESFKINKGHIIRNVLECPFHKVVLDHLVVDNELILESDSVKSKVDTRKHSVVANVSDIWPRQYQLLDYVFNEAFSGVMSSVKFSELLDVISNLPDGKAAGFLGITNKLWKHCDKLILNMLLVLLNFCLSSKSVLRPWVEAWVSMIPKSYEIFLACSLFDIFCGDNFSVLKDMTTQSSIFAVKSVVEDFGQDQDVCCAEYQAGLSSFFAAGVFIDDTIWIGSSQAATQYILDVANSSLANFFWFYGEVSMFAVLVSDGIGSLNIFESSGFVSVCDCLLQVGADSLSVYMNEFFSNLGTVGCRANTIVFFENIELGLGVSVSDLMSSTLVELQAIALALESVPPLSSINLFLDSQSALDAYKFELGLTCLDFCN